MKTIKLVGLVLAFVLMGMSANAQTDKFAALAIDKANGFYYGWAYDLPSLAIAESRAIAECVKRGGKCSVVLSWSGTGCGVYRTVKEDVGTAYGWGIATTQGAADKIATEEALKRSNGKPAVNFVFGCNSATKEALKVIQNDSIDTNTVAQVGHSGEITAIALSPNSKMLVSGGYDKTAKLWDVSSGKILRTIETAEPVYGVFFLPDGKTFGIQGSRKVAFHDTVSGQEIKSATLQGSSGVAVSNDGKTFMTFEYDTVTLWDVTSLKKIKTLSIPGFNSPKIFSNDFTTFVSGDEDGGIKLYDFASGNISKTFAGHRGEKDEGVIIKELGVTFDGKIIASVSDINNIRLWSAVSGQELKPLSGHSDRVHVLAFSPDGKVLASASMDKTIRLWDVASGEQLKSFTGHRGRFPVSSLAFSLDGKTLASGGGESDKTIKLWDVATGLELKTLK